MKSHLNRKAVWTGWRRGKYPPSPGMESSVIQSSSHGLLPYRVSDPVLVRNSNEFSRFIPPKEMAEILSNCRTIYRGADKSLARPRRKQAGSISSDTRDFNNIETRAVNRSFFLQSKTPKEIHAVLTETLACFLPGRAKDLSAPL